MVIFLSTTSKYTNYLTLTLSHLDLAGATQRGWLSEMTPLPMGVGRKGSWCLITNSLTLCSAPQYAAPKGGQRMFQIYLNITWNIYSTHCMYHTIACHMTNEVYTR